MNTENGKTNEQYKCVLNLSQRLDLRSSNEHVALQSLSIYYTWKNIRKQYKNNNLIVPTSNAEFGLPGSLIQCQILKIISSISLKTWNITHQSFYLYLHQQD